jgi:hypothetical protein
MVLNVLATTAYGGAVVSCTLYVSGNANWVDCLTDTAMLSGDVLFSGEVSSYHVFSVYETPEERLTKWRMEEEVNRLMRSKRPMDKLRLQQLQRQLLLMD